MSDFINTIDVLGDDAVVDSIINRTITEFKDNMLTKLGREAFNSCAALTSIDLPAVTVIEQGAFGNCKALESANLPLAISTGSQGFRGCSKLKSISIPAAKSIDYLSLEGCGSLEMIDSPLVEVVNPWAGLGGAIEILDLPSLKKIDMGGIQGNKIKALVLRYDGVCTLASFGNTLPTVREETIGYVYVPSARLEEYKAATSWCEHPGRIRALEDYTVDGTITGDLDKTKI